MQRCSFEIHYPNGRTPKFTCHDSHKQIPPVFLVFLFPTILHITFVTVNPMDDSSDSMRGASAGGTCSYHHPYFVFQKQIDNIWANATLGGDPTAEKMANAAESKYGSES